jgi:hypothetical protein
MKYNLKVYEHVLKNKTKLEQDIKSITNEINITEDFKILNILHTKRKKLESKYNSLCKKIDSNEFNKTKLKNIKEKYNFKHWFQQYPHYVYQDILVVAGKNAEKSDTLKSRLKYANWYYHVSAITGGSVIRFEKEYDTFAHLLASSFCLMFSSYWKTSTNNPHKIDVVDTKYVITKNLKKGQFALVNSTKILAEVNIFIYYDEYRKVLTYNPSNIKIGYIEKNIYCLLKPQLIKCLEFYKGLKDYTILDLWFPLTGVLVYDFKKN